jgi:hypothetical protein
MSRPSSTRRYERSVVEPRRKVDFPVAVFLLAGAKEGGTDTGNPPDDLKPGSAKVPAGRKSGSLCPDNRLGRSGSCLSNFAHCCCNSASQRCFDSAGRTPELPFTKHASARRPPKGRYDAPPANALAPASVRPFSRRLPNPGFPEAHGPKPLLSPRRETIFEPTSPPDLNWCGRRRSRLRNRPVDSETWVRRPRRLRLRWPPR